MKIVIGGMPGSGHTAISRKVADRLGLDFMCAKDVTNSICSSNHVDVKMHSMQFVNDLAQSVDSILKIFIESHDDYLCDAVLFNKNTEGVISIFIDSELTAEVSLPYSVYRRRRTLREYFRTVHNRDCFDTSQYDIVINRTLCTDDYIVQFIIDLLSRGERGYYVPCGICLPLNAPAVLELTTHLKSTEFSIGKFFGLHVIEDNLSQAMLHAKHNKLLKVRDSVLHNITELEIKPMYNYTEWFYNVTKDYSVVQLSTMLARHCSKFDMFDVESAFVELTVNGNPVKRLIELGYAD